MLICQLPTRRSLWLLPILLLLASAIAAPVAAQSAATRTGAMTVQRSLPVATLLDDGRVLVTGGSRTEGAGTAINDSAEIYDPQTGAFSATGSMSVPRVRHAAVRLAGGRVLVLGGSISATASTNLAEIFDPARGSFAVVGQMFWPRERLTASPLPDGRVLVVGGGRNNGNGSIALWTSTEIYNPLGGGFTEGAGSSQFHLGDPSVVLPDGRVMIFGGQTLASGFIVPGSMDVELYDPAMGSFSTAGRLNEVRMNPAATLLPDGRVVVSGGQLLTPDGKSLIDESRTVEVFDPSTGTSTTVSPMSEARASHTAALLPDGRVLLAGGTVGAGASAHSTASADLFDPQTGKITPAAPLTATRTQGAAVTLPDGRVLIVGGIQITNGTVTARLQTAEIYKP